MGAMPTLAVGMFAAILGIHMPTASVGMAPKTHESTTDRALARTVTLGSRCAALRGNPGLSSASPSGYFIRRDLLLAERTRGGRSVNGYTGMTTKNEPLGAESSGPRGFSV